MKLVIATFDSGTFAGTYNWIADWPIIVERPLSLEDALCRATGLRLEVLRFAKLMEGKLRKHDEDRGQQGWVNDEPESLADRIGTYTLGGDASELCELFNAIERWRVGPAHLNEKQVKAVAEEAADVANFAMMVADVVGGLKR